jgi:hypothetical protein
MEAEGSEVEVGRQQEIDISCFTGRYRILILAWRSTPTHLSYR